MRDLCNARGVVIGPQKGRASSIEAVQVGVFNRAAAEQLGAMDPQCSFWDADRGAQCRQRRRTVERCQFFLENGQ